MSENPYQAPTIRTESPVKKARHQNEYASQTKRFLNFIIDQVILRICTGAVGFALGFAYGSSIVAQGRQVTASDETFIYFVGLFVGLAMVVLYFVLLEGAFKITIGKLITGTKVVSEDGSDATMGQIIGRSFCRLIPFEPFSFLFGDNTTGWHDSLSKTRVINTR